MSQIRVVWLVLIPLVGVLIILLVLSWVLTIQHVSSMEGMMRDMMGVDIRGAWIPAPMIAPLIAASISLIVAVFVIYYALAPRSRFTGRVLGLTEEEASVVALLEDNGGHLLQRDIARSLNMTRLKTHRVVSSLRKRGVVTVEPWGSTKIVRLVRSREEPGRGDG